MGDSPEGAEAAERPLLPSHLPAPSVSKHVSREKSPLSSVAGSLLAVGEVTAGGAIMNNPI